MRARFSRFAMWCALTAAAAVCARGEDVRAVATVDSNTILIGDWVVLRVEVRRPAAAAVTWPALAESLKGLEIVAQQGPAGRTEGEDVVESATLTLTAFDSGLYIIPPLLFTYPAHGGGTASASTSPIPLVVHGIAVDTTREIRDVKAPLAVPLSFAEIWPYLAGAVVAGAAAWLAVVLMRKRKRGERFIPEPPPRPAHEQALDALRALEAERLWQRGKVKEYYSGVTDILRLYMERRFGFPALEMTTEEILASDDMAGPDMQLRDRLRQQLMLADMVKFAKFRPSEKEHESVLAFAFEFVESTWRAPAPAEAGA